MMFNEVYAVKPFPETGVLSYRKAQYLGIGL